MDKPTRNWKIASYQRPKSGTCVIEGPNGMLGWVGDGMPRKGNQDRGDYSLAEKNARFIIAACRFYEEHLRKLNLEFD